jgi:histidinol-phosphate phosphatase family protein
MGRRAKALILTRELGSRPHPETDADAKWLLPIGDRPLLDYWVRCLAEAGISEAWIATHSHAYAACAQKYAESLDGGSSFRLAVSYSPGVLGLAEAVAANVDLADDSDDVLIVCANIISDIDVRPLIEFHRQHDDPLTMVLFRASKPFACDTTAELNEEGRIVSFVEKPEWPTSDLANAGLYVLDTEAYREIAGMGAFDLGYSAILRFVGRMRGWIWGGYYLRIENDEALELARCDAASIFARQVNISQGLHQPAIFLDRDGTLIKDVHYLSDPGLIQLLPGAAEALKRFRRAGFACVLVTNQSAIGRGMLTVEGLDEIHVEMNRQLAAFGATIDAIYYCPDVPASGDRSAVENSDRKPGPGMLLRAAADLRLDLRTSWMVGDLISDVLAGQNAGCRSILLESGQTSPEQARTLAGRFLTASNLMAAADLILADYGEEE